MTGVCSLPSWRKRLQKVHQRRQDFDWVWHELLQKSKKCLSWWIHAICELHWQIIYWFWIQTVSIYLIIYFCYCKKMFTFVFNKISLTTNINWSVQKTEYFLKLTKSSSHCCRCRNTQSVFDQCMLEQMQMSKPAAGYFSRAKVLDSERSVNNIVIIDMICTPFQCSELRNQFICFELVKLVWLFYLQFISLVMYLLCCLVIMYASTYGL